MLSRQTKRRVYWRAARSRTARSMGSRYLHHRLRVTVGRSRRWRGPLFAAALLAVAIGGAVVARAAAGRPAEEPR